MKKYLLLILCLFFTGCGPVLYYHPEKSPQQFEKDKYDCEMEAYARSVAKGFPGNPFIVNEEFHRCLRLKHGWCPQG